MKITTLVLLLAIGFGTYAQKLPNVQQVSLRAPANVKVDGKVTEWGDNLQAYNKDTEIYYTLSNNKDCLYLTVKATEPDIIDKILLGGGLAFTINKDGNKKQKNGIMITYPAYPKGTKRAFFALYKIKEIREDKQNYRARLDSLMTANNLKIKNEFKFIGTSGIKDKRAEMIPIYNEEGVMAAAMFDENLYFNFELAIPLKLIGNYDPLTYNIQLNGLAFGGSDLKMVRDRFLVFKGADGKDYMLGDATSRNWSLATPSDFWGEYTLAK